MGYITIGSSVRSSADVGLMSHLLNISQGRPSAHTEPDKEGNAVGAQTRNGTPDYKSRRLFTKPAFHNIGVDKAREEAVHFSYAAHCRCSPNHYHGTPMPETLMRS